MPTRVDIDGANFSSGFVLSLYWEETEGLRVCLFVRSRPISPLGLIFRYFWQRAHAGVIASIVMSQRVVSSSYSNHYVQRCNSPSAEFEPLHAQQNTDHQFHRLFSLSLSHADNFCTTWNQFFCITQIIFKSEANHAI